MSTRSTAVDVATLGLDRFSDPLNFSGRNGVNDTFKATSYNLPTANPFLPQVQGAIDATQKQNFDTQAAQLDQSPANQFRMQQMAVAHQLAAQANGTAPSLAAMQLKQGQDAAIQNAAATAASQRGISPGMAARLQAQGTAGLMQQNNAQSAQLRLQEQQAAQQALAGLSSTARGQDLGAASTNAGYEQQTALANQQAGLNKAQLVAGMLGQGASTAQAQNELGSQNYNTAQQINADVAKADAELKQKTQGGMLGALGGAAGAIFSDERLKTNVDYEKAGDDLKGFLDALNPARFDYKSETHGGKENYGFMAQDAEKSRVGKSMVVETPDGKAIDSKRALMAAIASVAHLNKRLTKVEHAHA